MLTLKNKIIPLTEAKITKIDFFLIFKITHLLPLTCCLYSNELYVAQHCENPFKKCFLRKKTRLTFIHVLIERMSNAFRKMACFQ